MAFAELSPAYRTTLANGLYNSLHYRTGVTLEVYRGTQTVGRAERTNERLGAVDVVGGGRSDGPVVPVSQRARESDHVEQISRSEFLQ